MCGIVGAVAQRDVVEILLEGLRRLEYRGYDSAGICISCADGQKRVRSLGKVSELARLIHADPLPGSTGIAHTRWATHGKPSVANAHPHVSDTVAVVHNGIIENYAELRNELSAKGYEFKSETDTETIAHLVNECRKSCNSLIEAVSAAVKSLKGAYAIAVTDSLEPGVMAVARQGSPLVIGLGIGENFVASDQLALLPVTRRFIFLEEGDTGLVTRNEVTVWDKNGGKVSRKEETSNLLNDAADKKGFSHFMQKEIHEQPEAISNTLEGRVGAGKFMPEAFGVNARELLSGVNHVRIVACGTSYHAGLVARYWLEEFAGVSCDVEIASEFRYRSSVTPKDTLLVTISQSGETADTLEALRLSKKNGVRAALSICNVPGSSLVRESDLCFMTRAGAEIGVASTKAFVTQLTALMLLTGCIGVCRGYLTDELEKRLADGLLSMPNYVREVLNYEKEFAEVARKIRNRQSCLFLGRGANWPIAMEGALKLKEISYIHAEAYAAGELKHGPIALIDENMPVIVVAPTDRLSAKLMSNVETVRARNGELYILTDSDTDCSALMDGAGGLCSVIRMPKVDEFFAPVVYTVPLQLISYHAAVLKGTDVDQPRNLAKSVTVE